MGTQQRLPINPYTRGYASRTGTRSTLLALRQAGWRLLVSATGVWRTEGFPYALDNGAWTAFQQSKPFNEGLFRGLVEQLGADADWVVAPDIVAGGLTSLAYTESWLPWVLERSERVLVAVQDGMGKKDIRAMLQQDSRLGIFLGGSTEWKEATMPEWGELALETGRYFHVGRVNSQRRIRMCRQNKAHSFDGTGPILFPCKLPLLNRARTEYNACLTL